uniref:Uncharacterized protein n=1 Tax=Rhizophora mucronata TaxID=61149 RepID=A0A2P2R4D7_RHIMU
MSQRWISNPYPNREIQSRVIPSILLFF